MKLYEKVLIGIVTVLFGTQLFNFPGNVVLFLFAIWLLGISYAIGGYKLFNPKDKTTLVISIFAGIAFAVAIVTLPFTIRLNLGFFCEISPIFNAAFLVVSVIYVYIKRKSKQALLKDTKNIFIRSLIILVVTSFFAYCPISFKPYKKIVLALNVSDQYLVNNILMFSYSEDSEDAIKNGDCDLAIEYAEKANVCGKIWLGITPNENGYFLKEDSSILWKIMGSYQDIYEAYKCKADVLYNEKKYDLALELYLKADKYLYIDSNPSTFYEIEKSYSINSIALCYRFLFKYNQADSLFLKAIDLYKLVKDTNDTKIAIFLSNLADSYSAQEYYTYANEIYQAAVDIRLKGYLKDSSNTKNKKELVSCYIELALNFIRSDSLETVPFYLEKALQIGGKNDVNYCSANLYYSVYYYRMSKYLKADSIANKCIECYKKQLEPTNQNIAESYLMLTKINITLANYKTAEEYLHNGIGITIKNYGTNSSRYANFIKVQAHLKKEIGKYEEAENLLYRVINLYATGLRGNNRKQFEVLSDLADLELILGKFQNAKAHSDSSLSMASIYSNLQSPGSTSLLNDAAYVNYYIGEYSVSDKLYRKTLRINNLFGLEHTASTAIALNGLGLVTTEKKKFIKADSLLRASLLLHKEIFGEDHPFTAIVYLNFASLKIKENKLLEAKEMVTKSLNINKNFFDDQHDIFADINIAFGDIAKKENKKKVALDCYQKALKIYLNKFDKKHFKVLLANQKLKLL